MNGLTKLLMKKHENSAAKNRRRSMMMSAAALQIEQLEEEEGQWGGSSESRTYIYRDREAMDQRLKALYFTEPCRFQPNIFRKRFRMSPTLFDKIMREVANYDPYFIQKQNATGRLGFFTEQKLTCAFKMLAYNISADVFDDYLDIAQSTALEILEHFTRAIWNVYHKDYLRRPTKADVTRLLNKADDRGSPGMVGSLDCMHWQWKNCPTGWQCQYTGYKGKPTMVLEAVVSYDTWIWHAFFGLPGFLNDLNVLGSSPLFDDILRGESPLVKYEVNGKSYGQTYYLVDGIYPKWASFVQAIKNLRLEDTKLFTKMQEAYRKDVERAFGILQARWAIIRGPARGWSKENLQYIMMACIIMHNMIIDDERKEDEAVPFDFDDIPTQPKKAEIYDRPEIDEDGDPLETHVDRNKHKLEQVLQRYWDIKSPVVNKSLQGDLVKHLYAKMERDRQNLE